MISKDWIWHIKGGNLKWVKFAQASCGDESGGSATNGEGMIETFRPQIFPIFFSWVGNTVLYYHSKFQKLGIGQKTLVTIFFSFLEFDQSSKFKVWHNSKQKFWHNSKNLNCDKTKKNWIVTVIYCPLFFVVVWEHCFAPVMIHCGSTSCAPCDKTQKLKLWKKKKIKLWQNSKTQIVT